MTCKKKRWENPFGKIDFRFVCGRTSCFISYIVHAFAEPGVGANFFLLAGSQSLNQSDHTMGHKHEL